jgi:protein-disulfide isomerase
MKMKAHVFSEVSARRRLTRGALLVAVLTFVSSLVGCTDRKVAAASTSATGKATSDAEFPDALATIGGQTITMADVRARVGDQLDQNETKFRVAQHKIVENTVRDILSERMLNAEAKKQGKTVDQLLAAEVGGSLEPTEVEVATWFKENQARVGGRALSAIAPEIANYLRKTRRTEATEKLEGRLTAENKVDVKLQPFRLAFDNAGAASRGPENSPVTLVEFSDFECPFCGRFFPTLKRIEEQYGDRIRIVYRQYPLPSLHANAFKAAEASLCAKDQGKFWEMHDLLFQEQNQLAIRDLKVKANRLGLDQKKFDECLDTGRFTAQVQADMREGDRVGVTGTPALFVNGIGIDGGAVPFETVAKAIDKELQRAKH